MAEVIAETERLILRTWRDEDRPIYLATCNTEAVTRHLNGPATEEEIDAAFARIVKHQNEQGFTFWAIERKSDRVLLGFCGLRIATILGDRSTARSRLVGACAKTRGARPMRVRLRWRRWNGLGPTSMLTESSPSRFLRMSRAGD